VLVVVAVEAERGMEVLRARSDCRCPADAVAKQPEPCQAGQQQR
jgi:hypothetical protein